MLLTLALIAWMCGEAEAAQFLWKLWLLELCATLILVGLLAVSG